MDDCKIEYINEGFKEIINSDALGRVCLDQAYRIAYPSVRTATPSLSTT